MMLFMTLLLLFFGQIYGQKKACEESQESSAMRCSLLLLPLSRFLDQELQLGGTVENFWDPESQVMEAFCEKVALLEDCLRQNVYLEKKKCRFSMSLNQFPHMGLNIFCKNSTKRAVIEGQPCLTSIMESEKREECDVPIRDIISKTFVGLTGREEANEARCEVAEMVRAAFNCVYPPVREQCERNVFRPLRAIGRKFRRVLKRQQCSVVAP